MARSKDILRHLTANNQNQRSQQRRGPKPKPIKDRQLKPSNLRPIQRLEISWSQKQKLRVLVFLYHHRIPTRFGQYRSPTQQEAAEIFQVPQPTISEWVRNQKKIEQQKPTDRSSREAVICQWPELETRLYEEFLERRKQGRSVRQSWFRAHAYEIFRDLYPSSDTSIFRFSNGWFHSFLQRNRVSLRSITKTAQMIPEEYQKLVVNWLRFNRRNSQPRPENWLETVLIRTVDRYYLSNIFNIDETPIPFEYLSGRTYDIIGSKTIWVKESRSGWDKRQVNTLRPPK